MRALRRASRGPGGGGGGGKGMGGGSVRCRALEREIRGYNWTPFRRVEAYRAPASESRSATTRHTRLGTVSGILGPLGLGRTARSRSLLDPCRAVPFDPRLDRRLRVPLVAAESPLRGVVVEPTPSTQRFIISRGGALEFVRFDCLADVHSCF